MTHLVNEVARLRAVLALVKPALELGLDALRAEASAYHAAMKGYRPLHHVQMDEDCKTAEVALRAVENEL
jgi:hypothetical protein